jgi:hypothetical protein
MNNSVMLLALLGVTLVLAVSSAQGQDEPNTLQSISFFENEDCTGAEDTFTDSNFWEEGNKKSYKWNGL